ncbi:hypothetical protein GGF37_002758, partial [Kickxella alabastrina]
QTARIERLSLAQCELDAVPDSLSLLYALSWLDLQANAITDLADISLKLGSIVRLNLAHNAIADVSGLRRLWALESLDLSGNLIDRWEALLVLRNLPSLADLRVAGNPFVEADAMGGYRAQVFSAFDHRDVALELDASGPTAQERRAMAKIPRVATGHCTAVATTTAADAEAAGVKVTSPRTMQAAAAVAVAVAKLRRPKVAFIEESQDDYPSDTSSVAKSPRASMAIASPAPLLSLADKTPHVMRATELQEAVTMAAGHRRSSMVGALPATSPVAMHQGTALKRRATATTATGLRMSPLAIQRQGQTSLTPPMPPPASAQSYTPGRPEGRDPERYRRRVEMMRAEAGSSWLRAFAELQSQSPAPAAGTGAVHCESDWGSERTVESPAAVSRSSSSSPERVSAGANPNANALDTQLPSFLFPRRRNAAAGAAAGASRKKDVARLPHYTESEPECASAAGSVAGSVPAEVIIERVVADTAEADAEALSGKEEDNDNGKMGKEGALPAISELQRILKSDATARVVAEEISVVRYQCVPLAMASDSGGAVQRVECGVRTVIVTSAEVIELDVSGDRTAATTPLKAIVRVAASAEEAVMLVEAKGDRFDSPAWTEYAFTDDLFSAIDSAAKGNAERGLEAHLYKQAECLRCSWRGFIDREYWIFDKLLGCVCSASTLADEFVAVESGPTAELQCPECGRSYLREFYAADEDPAVTPIAANDSSFGDGGGGGSNGSDDVWRQALRSRRPKAAAVSDKPTDRDHMAAAVAAAAEHRAQCMREARRLAAADVGRMGAAAQPGSLAFGEATNAVRLFLELSVFGAEGERLMRWVPAGLVRQMQPLVPASFSSSGSANANAGAASASALAPGLAEKSAVPSKWGLASFLGGGGGSSASPSDSRTLASAVSSKTQKDKNLAAAQQSAADAAALEPALCEQAVFLALSSHALYVFSPTWAALDSTSLPLRSEIELQPERYLALVFTLPLTELGRIDIGPNRQYLALHSALLSISEDSPVLIHWVSAPLQKLLTPALHPAYPRKGFIESSSLSQEFVSAQHRARSPFPGSAGGDKGGSTAAGGSALAASSCVLMIRDRLACSDLLDALVEIGYETRVLDSGAGAGSGRLRAINHDVEWAMHNLVQQVFLRPDTFSDLDDEHKDMAPVPAPAAAGAELVCQDRLRTLHTLHHELLRSPNSQQPGSLVDAASGDNVIIDKVTYEFLQLYFCVGLSPVNPSSSSLQGIQPVTLVGSPQFVYLVRERVDVWPPPVPDMNLVYRHLQRVEPPTIVTSDPDTYDPKVLAKELLARKSNATSAGSAMSARSALNGCAGMEEATAAAVMVDPLLNQLVASGVSQYDRVLRARPVADLRRIVLVNYPVAVLPRPLGQQQQQQKQQRLPVDPPNGSAAAAVAAGQGDYDEEVLGCVGTSWHAMLRIEFATVERTGDANVSDAAENLEEQDVSGWCVWFATLASAQECAESLQVLAASSKVTGLEFYEA